MAEALLAVDFQEEIQVESEPPPKKRRILDLPHAYSARGDLFKLQLPLRNGAA